MSKYAIPGTSTSPLERKVAVLESAVATLVRMANPVAFQAEAARMRFDAGLAAVGQQVRDGALVATNVVGPLTEAVHYVDMRDGQQMTEGLPMLIGLANLAKEIRAKFAGKSIGDVLSDADARAKIVACWDRVAPKRKVKRGR